MDGREEGLHTSSHRGQYPNVDLSLAVTYLVPTQGSTDGPRLLKPTEEDSLTILQKLSTDTRSDFILVIQYWFTYPVQVTFLGCSSGLPMAENNS